jgi:hypothetical protein
VVAQQPSAELKEKLLASGKKLLDVVSSELSYLRKINE